MDAGRFKTVEGKDMRALLKMTTLQLEITNACQNQCSNCTRLVGHYPTWYMSMEQFKTAVDSMAGLHTMAPNCLVGIMGGEPLLHPHFEEICEYARSKFTPEHLGLWTCLPKGKERYRELIVNTFGNVFINDHSLNNIMHAPLLVAAHELKCLEDWQKWQLIDNCYAQEMWSASINPHGAFFCELAASLSMLLSKEPDGWPVEPGWWLRVPRDYNEQIDKYCMNCGFAMPLRKRASAEGIDDISPAVYELLKSTSKKIKAGKCRIHDLTIHQDNYNLSAQPYKDLSYRDAIANRYGLFLSNNERGYQSPHLFREFKQEVNSNGKFRKTAEV